MKRRIFLSLTAAILTAPLAVLAEGSLDYQPGLIQTALGEGKTVFVDYSAAWCGTCARQERVVNQLRDGNPAYDANIIFVRVDWDDFKRHEVTTSRNIPRRSTLLVLRGDQELGRVVAGTSEADIKALMDTGLTPAS